VVEDRLVLGHLHPDGGAGVDRLIHDPGSGEVIALGEDVLRIPAPPRLEVECDVAPGGEDEVAFAGGLDQQLQPAPVVPGHGTDAEGAAEFESGDQKERLRPGGPGGQIVVEERLETHRLRPRFHRAVPAQEVRGRQHIVSPVGHVRHVEVIGVHPHGEHVASAPGARLAEVVGTDVEGLVGHPPMVDRPAAVGPVLLRDDRVQYVPAELLERRDERIRRCIGGDAMKRGESALLPEGVEGAEPFDDLCNAERFPVGIVAGEARIDFADVVGHDVRIDRVAEILFERAEGGGDGLSGFDVVIDRNAVGVHHVFEGVGGECTDGDLDDGGVFADHPEIAEAVFARRRDFPDQVVASRRRRERFARLPPRDLPAVGERKMTVQDGIEFKENFLSPVVKIAHYLVSRETFTLSKKAR